MTALRRPSALGRPFLAVIAASVLLADATGVAAHGPDPILGGGLFDQNQALLFHWRSGAEPPTVIKTAIRAASIDATASRASKAATIGYDAAGPNLIGYGSGAPCGVNGLACFTRDAPDGFGMWLREQGHVYDWGTLKWCQTYTAPPNGCYDAETIALDEFGHVEGLDHHVNYSDDRDFEDAVVQTFSRVKPATGWNAHDFGACDVATLQRRYDVPGWTTPYSSCLDLATTLGLAASETWVGLGSSTRLTATLKVADLDAYERLGANPVSARTVALQRRVIGTTAWVAAGTMTPGTAAGTYVATARLVTGSEFRAVFKAPAGEGLDGATSAIVRVLVGNCSGTSCPQAPPASDLVRLKGAAS